MSKYGITVKTLDYAAGMELSGGQNWFHVEGQPVIVYKDPIVPHLPPLSPICFTAPAQSADKSTWMFIDNIPVIREKHTANCGHQATGRDWWKIID